MHFSGLLTYMGLPNCFCDFNGWAGTVVNLISLKHLQSANKPYMMYHIIPVMLCVGLIITGIILILSLDSVAYGYALIGITLVGAANYVVITRFRARKAAERQAALHAPPIV